MSGNNKENIAVQKHIDILQEIINRMAGNSFYCKSWAITLISAILVVLFDKSKMNTIYIVYLPLGMFYFLDSFYLGLERHFRDKYNDFISMLCKDEFNFNSVLVINGPGGFCEKCQLTIKGLFSFSTLPFYVVLMFLVSIIQKYS